MIQWLIHATVVGVLLLVAALALEGCARNLRLPVRWIWVVALAGTLALSAAAAFRAEPIGVTPLTVETSASTLLPKQPAPDGLASLIADARAAIDAALAAPVVVADRIDDAVARMATTWFVVLWLSASAGLLLALIATVRRSRSARSRWPLCSIAGEQVRVAPTVGPALIGVLRPEIVVPAWLLGASEGDQAMIVAHERAHRTARDHLLLASGCVAVVLLPWHPCVWWMASRLRLAVELDCDARVLRAGAATTNYGALLLDVAARYTALPFGAAALADSPSHLERRLLAMTRHTPRHAAIRTGALACAAIALVFAACEADLPTSAELEGMNVAQLAEKTAQVTGKVLLSEAPLYVVDDVVTDAGTARALPPEAIASVDIRRPLRADGSPGRSVIDIRTVAAAAHHAESAAAGEPGATARRAPLRKVAERASIMSDTFDGILVIDGERADPAELQRISPESIESIEVFKGAAAARLFSDPAAQNGVIQLRTKAGGS